MRLPVYRLSVILFAAAIGGIFTGCQAQPVSIRVPLSQPSPAVETPAYPVATSGAPAPVATATPTIAGATAPAGEPALPPTGLEAYPSPIDQLPTGGTLIPTATPPAFQGGGYPVPSPTAGPLVDQNLAVLIGQIVDIAPDDQNPAQTRVRALVITSKDVPGIPNLTQGLVNHESDFYIDTGKLPGLAPGDTFLAQVVFDPSQFGGRFIILEIKKQE